MTDWATFVGFTGVVLLSILVLAWLSQDTVRTALSEPDDPQPDSGADDAERDFDTADTERDFDTADAERGSGAADPGTADDGAVTDADDGAGAIGGDGDRAAEIRRFNRVMEAWIT